MRHFIESVGFKILLSLINLIPISLVQNVGKVLGKMFFLLNSKRREIAINNLQNAFPTKPNIDIKKIAKRTFENVGITFCEFLRMKNIHRQDIHKMISIEDEEKFSQIVKRNNGALFLSGHLGNWELLAAYIGIVLPVPLKIIVKSQHNEFVDKEINRIRTKFGNKTVPMEQAIKEAMKTLNDKKFLALLSDQSAPKESVFVNFFGRNVATFKGPAAFCLKTRTPLVMLYCIRQKNYTYKVYCDELVFSDLKEYTEENIQELTQRHTTLLKEWICKFPEQWLWMHRRWKNVQ